MGKSNKTKDATEILDRLALALGMTSDVELAEALGVGRSTVGVWKSRGTIPIRHFIDLAKRSSLDLNWLLLGEGERERRQDGRGTQPDRAREGETPPDGSSLRPSIEKAAQAADVELGLGEVASLARLGTLAGAWEVMALIEEAHPNLCPIERLETAEIDGDNLRAYLTYLLRLGLINESEPGRFGLPLGSSFWRMESRTTPDVQQHALETIRALLREFVPAVEERRGRLLLFRGRVAVGEGVALAKDLVRLVKERAAQAAEPEGSEEGFTLSLGVGVRTGEVISFEDTKSQQGKR